MNKLLLGSAAIAGLLLASAPAQAQMELTIGGHSKNYIGYLDQDESVGNEARNFDMIRETELHFNGESTLDNGLTFGFQVEIEADAGDDANTIEESYIYMSGTWGRINLGSEDGAAYLLQVAAPSADSNIDGIRQYVQPVNYRISSINVGAATGAGLDVLDYDNDATGVDEKLTYLTPNYNGFQAGFSYTPEVADGSFEDINSSNPLNGFSVDNQEDNFGAGYEAGLRYEGVMSNFGYALGGGYSFIETEQDSVGNNTDDQQQWNVGLDIDAGPFGIGAVYTQTDNVALADGLDGATWVVGADYTTGPFKFGASYLNNQTDSTVTTELDTDRYTGGVIYTAGPGLSFRGSVSYIDHDLGAADADATSVLGGIQINF